MPSFKLNPKHHNIVVLESALTGLPQELDLPGCTYDISSYSHTSADEIESGIQDATIIVVVTLKLDSHLLSKDVSPNLELIDYVASGTDGVDLEACIERGIRLCNAPGASAAAVSEHAIGLYFAVRRRLLKTHEAV